MSEIKLSIGGMSCAHCTNRVKKAIDAVDGVEASTVALDGAVVRINDSRTTQQAVERAVTEAGYKVL